MVDLKTKVLPIFDSFWNRIAKTSYYCSMTLVFSELCLFFPLPRLKYMKHREKIQLKLNVTQTMICITRKSNLTLTLRLYMLFIAHFTQLCNSYVKTSLISSNKVWCVKYYSISSGSFIVTELCSFKHRLKKYTSCLASRY